MKKLYKVIFLTILVIVIFWTIEFIIRKNLNINLIGDKVKYIEVNSQYIEEGASATLFKKDLSKYIQEKGNVNVSKIGEYNIEYKIRNAKILRKVIVQDTQKPEISLNGTEIETLPYGSEYKEEGFVAMDNYDGDITNNVQIQKENINDTTQKIIYSVKDSSGNECNKDRTIIVENRNIDSNNNNQNLIYLTFDDGPSISTTTRILDILKEENVKATFFILNFDKKEEYLVKRIVEEGHSIGIHGYSHNYKEIYKSEEAYFQNIQKLQEKIRELTGIDTIITRFPGGSSNTVSKFNPGIMTRLSKEIVKKGYRYFDWNVSSGDSGDVKTKEEVYKNVTKGLKKGRSNVVLMHDFAHNKKTEEALREIIQFGKNNGYIFKAITADTPMVTQKIQN